MKHNFSLSLISSILLCAAAPTLVAQGGTAEPLSCADHSITARAVRSPEGVEAFVQCAYEFVQEVVPAQPVNATPALNPLAGVSERRGGQVA